MDHATLRSPTPTGAGWTSADDVRRLIDGLESLRRGLDVVRLQLVARAVAGERGQAEARSRAAHPAGHRLRPRLVVSPPP